MSELLSGRLAIKARLIHPGQAQAVEVGEGQLLQVTDAKGKQVADFVAISRADKHEWLSVAATRSMNTNLMLQRGMTLYSNRRSPMFEVVEDSVGRHDMLFAACDPKRYEAMGVPGHASCRAALTEVLTPFAIGFDHVPDPINWFMNVAVKQRGELEVREPLSEANDYVVLRALMPVIAAVTACPQDLNPTNGMNPTDILIRVYR
jgi:hypothetical protein